LAKTSHDLLCGALGSMPCRIRVSIASGERGLPENSQRSVPGSNLGQVIN
jgi:hypothetical protein